MFDTPDISLTITPMPWRAQQNMDETDEQNNPCCFQYPGALGPLNIFDLCG
ncbi:hypothetical protein [Desulfobacula sp.]|uniref:hypothetical protein n=1 Tax=Desulfobacula sp. TaxID=2593537 RepID=UPI0026048E05|nr:hypothetical protein [Desulfobacula sp.]